MTVWPRFGLLQGNLGKCTRLAIINFLNRDELANIENKILEKKIADKKKEELRKKNIAVSIMTLFVYLRRMNNHFQMYGDSKRAQRFYQQDSDAEEEEELLPNPKLAQGESDGNKQKFKFFAIGNKLPRRYGAFPPELANMPLGKYA